MRQRVTLIPGTRWGSWTVTGEEIPGGRGGYPRIPVRCVCGSEAQVIKGRILAGKSTRCGRRCGYVTPERTRPECGTTTGSNLHNRYGELACRACLRWRADTRAAYLRAAAGRSRECPRCGREIPPGRGIPPHTTVRVGPAGQYDTGQTCE